MKKIFMTSISWIFVFIIAGSICFWFSMKAGIHVYKYFKLNSKTTCSIDKWELNEDKSSKYTIIVYYSYEVSNQIFNDKYIFKQKLFLNSFAAKDQINYWKNKKWTVFYNSKNPNISSIEKAFPYKSCIYAIIAMSIFLYFIFLKFYLIRFQKKL